MRELSHDYFPPLTDRREVQLFNPVGVSIFFPREFLDFSRIIPCLGISRRFPKNSLKKNCTGKSDFFPVLELL